MRHKSFIFCFAEKLVVCSDLKRNQNSSLARVGRVLLGWSELESGSRAGLLIGCVSHPETLLHFAGCSVN